MCGNSPSVWERVRISVREYPRTLTCPFNSGDPVIDERRALVREHLPADEPLYLFEPSGKGLTSRLRTMRICLAWEAMPQKVIPFTDTSLPPQMNYLATAVYEGPLPVKEDTFISLAQATEGPVWAQRELMKEKTPRDIPALSSWREFMGLLAPMLVMLGGAVLGGWAGLGTCLLAFSVGMGIPPLLGFTPSPVFVLGLMSVILCGQWLAIKKQKIFGLSVLESTNFRIALIFTFVLFALLAFLTLSHTFTSPNGLGVFGGKAKLLYLAGRIPSDFFTDPAWVTLQPAYPPGFALTTLGCYGLAGCCGEWLTQLLPCIFSAIICLFICVRFPISAAFWVAVTFLGFQSLWMSSLYYAEPIMLLLLLIGVDTILRKSGSVLGWVLVGGCGWMKTEGFLFLPFLWLALRLTDGKTRAPLHGLALGLVLPLWWLVWSRLHGATLYDYAPVYLPDFEQIGAAIVETLRLGFLEPWRYGFVFPLACVMPFIPQLRTRPMLAGIAVLLGYTMTIWWVFGISRAPDFEWHLRSLERLLWAPVILFLFHVMYELFKIEKQNTC